MQIWSNMTVAIQINHVILYLDLEVCNSLIICAIKQDITVNYSTCTEIWRELVRIACTHQDIQVYGGPYRLLDEVLCECLGVCWQDRTSWMQGWLDHDCLGSGYDDSQYSGLSRRPDHSIASTEPSSRVHMAAYPVCSHNSQLCSVSVINSQV